MHMISEIYDSKSVSMNIKVSILARKDPTRIFFDRFASSFCIQLPSNLFQKENTITVSVHIVICGPSFPSMQHMYQAAHD